MFARHCVGIAFILVTFIFKPIILFAQKPASITVFGTVRDSTDGETLQGVSIRAVGNEQVGVGTNTYGYYSINVPIGTDRLRFSFVGYEALERELTAEHSQRIDVVLRPSNQLEEVVVTDVSARRQLETAQMGVNTVSIEEINKVPVLFGERDVLKTIQLLPGVLAAGEGNSGFFVRGGTVDQNLILLDEAMIYNASHLLGFFSTFNSDAIKDVELYKGGMPAEYGGRLASVLDVSMIEGNSQRFEAEGGIGLISSRLKVEGPIEKGKGSFMVSGRRTYADLFLKLSPDSTVNSSRLYFYDLNLKANYRLDSLNTIFVSGYFGKDVLGYSDQFGFNWGNATGTLRWNHVYNERLFSNTALVYSNFDYNVNVFSENNDFSISSRLENINLKHDFSYFASNSSTVKFGVNLMHQKISPAGIDASEESDINSLRIDRRGGFDLSAYISHDWKITDRINALYGLRINNFSLMGPGRFNTYSEQGEIVTSDSIGRGGLAANYFNLEPRIALNYRLNEVSSVKASYNRNVQNIHQLSNSTASLPTDTWVMSSNNIRPQIADQASIGYYRNLDNDRYEFSTEVYYKDMQNQIDYRNGADLQANENVESELVYGIGRAYGVELYLKKRQGRLNGWVSYTLSRSERQFDEINNGSWFSARQDRTHDLALVGIFQLTERWSLSSTFIYSTGNAVTFPAGKYEISGEPIWYYTERNGYRMPDYHRIDFGATLDPKPGKRFGSSWTFSVYNAYNRKNAYLIDFRSNADNPNITEAYQIALFGIIPSVTWNFKF